MSSDTFLSVSTRQAWRGTALLVLGTDGWMGSHPLSGLFFHEARHLSCLDLELFGESPYLCSLSEVRPELLEASHVYPPVGRQGGGGSGSGRQGQRHGIFWRGLDLDVEWRLHPASLRLALRLTNRWNEDAEVDLAWRLDTDFADLVEAEEGRRQQAAEVESAVLGPQGRCQGVRFDYAHPDLPLSTRVTVGGAADWRWDGTRLSNRLHLPRQQTREIVLAVRPLEDGRCLSAADERAREARLSEWSRQVTRVTVRSELPLGEIVRQAIRDVGSLALLDGEADEWLTPAAGMPLYPAVFGRDAFSIAWHAAVLDRGEMLDATYRRLARWQGERRDDWRDEAPGRSLQQRRLGPLSRLGETPFARYYGDYASPMMFVISLAQMYAWSGRREVVERHWDDATAVLDWAERDGDRDGDGYLEYLTRSPRGPTHQGWKDSEDAVVNATGEQLEAPFAPCEIQGYWYAALQTMAVLARLLGRKDEAKRYWRQAKGLAKRFNRDFWMEEEGYVAFGLDRDKRPVRSITSNPGHCLISGILDDDKVPAVVERMFRPDLFSGWGVRTLSTRNPAYNPLGYHLGTVWPSENAVFTLGLRRYGYREEALRLFDSVVRLARLWRHDRIPECVGGYAREERAHPGCYPHANSPQGWNQSGMVVMVQGLLGLQPLASLGVLVVDPVLPEWLTDLRLRRLRVGEAQVDLRFWRDGDGRSHFEVSRREGSLRVVRQPPPESQTAGPWDRIRGLAETVRRGLW